MPKPKRQRRQATLYREGETPTPERMAKGDFGKMAAPRIEGHDHGNIEVAYALPATHNWKRAGWIDDVQAEALEAWAALEALCAWHAPARDYANMRFGSGLGCRPEWLGDARERWRGIHGYLVEEFEERPIVCLMEWLTTPGQPDYAQAFPHGVNKAKGLARLFIIAVADELRGLLR